VLLTSTLVSGNFECRTFQNYKHWWFYWQDIFVKILRAPASRFEQMVNLSFHFSARQASEINNLRCWFLWGSKFLRVWWFHKRRVQHQLLLKSAEPSIPKIKICPWFLSIYSGVYCMMYDDGTGTMIFSRIPIFLICFVWYQNCKNNWIGSVMTLAGTPRNAAGINIK
jgi:hypothetical protein